MSFTPVDLLDRWPDDFYEPYISPLCKERPSIVNTYNISLGESLNEQERTYHYPNDVKVTVKNATLLWKEGLIHKLTTPSGYTYISPGWTHIEVIT